MEPARGLGSSRQNRSCHSTRVRVKLGRHSRRRGSSDATSDATIPLPHWVSIGLLLYCPNCSGSGWGDANATQYKPNGAMPQHDRAARGASASLFSVSAPLEMDLTWVRGTLQSDMGPVSQLGAAPIWASGGVCRQAPRQKQHQKSCRQRIHVRSPQWNAVPTALGLKARRVAWHCDNIQPVCGGGTLGLPWIGPWPLDPPPGSSYVPPLGLEGQAPGASHIHACHRSPR